MFCRKCGSQINEDDKFCPVCGTAIIKINEKNDVVPSIIQNKSDNNRGEIKQQSNSIEDQIICPECGNEFSKKSMACPICGIPMEKINELLESDEYRIFRGISKMHSAIEITGYIKSLGNPELNSLIEELDKIAYIEKMYGNKRKEAINKICSFMQFDLSQEEINNLCKEKTSHPKQESKTENKEELYYYKRFGEEQVFGPIKMTAINEMVLNGEIDKYIYVSKDNISWEDYKDYNPRLFPSAKAKSDTSKKQDIGKERAPIESAPKENAPKENAPEGFFDIRRLILSIIAGCGFIILVGLSDLLKLVCVILVFGASCAIAYVVFSKKMGKGSATVLTVIVGIIVTFLALALIGVWYEWAEDPWISESVYLLRCLPVVIPATLIAYIIMSINDMDDDF